MKKTFIRIISFCLTLVMLLQVVPLSADALSYSGSSSYKSGKYYTALTKVKLTGNQRTDIVNIAKSQVGYQEGSSSSQLSGTKYGGKNYTEYGRWYGMQDMWCAMFVSWCANVAGISTSIIPKHAYTPSGLSWFQSRGLAYSRKTVANGGYTPKAGDIIYFKSSRNSNSTNHIGIVTGYSNGTVYTIEGNTSSATISTNGGAVAAKSYSISNTYIVYICKPNYKNSGSSSGGSGGGSSGAKYSGKNNWIPDSVQSIVFDPTYYSSKYADLKAAFGTDGNKLYQHFLDYGAKEGRQASATFNVRTYLSKNSDLKAAFGDDYKAAIKHFASFGINENRVTAPCVNLGNSFKAKINVSTASLNLSLSDTNVIAYTPSDAAAQIWKFDRQSNGTYKITNTKTGQVLDVKGASKTAGANIDIYDSNNTNAQRWYIYESGVSGKYVFRPACAPGVVMGVKGDSTAAMANIETVKYTNTKGQRFGITKISSGSSTQKPAEEKPADLGKEFYAKIATSNATNKKLSLSDSDVILYENSKAAAQTWRFVRQSDGSYHIINQKTGQYLTVPGNSSTSGTGVKIEKGSSASGQKWFIYAKNGYYMFRPACSTKCVLDVYGASTADLAKLNIYEKNGTGAQLFTITKGNYFDLVGPVDVGTGFVANIRNVNSGLNLSLCDSNVIIYTPSNAAAQKYKFDRQSDGSYKLTNQKNNYVLDVYGGSSKNLTNVQIKKSNNTSAQRWFIYLKEGTYIFRPGCAKTAVLDVYSGATSPMTNVDIYEMNNTAAQKFTIIHCDGSATSSGNQYATAEQMAVLRKIMYAVETGGQVYGNARYDDFTEAYTNTPEEHAITIGAGQWFGPEAKKLLNTIRSKYPTTFASLDTAGIAKDLDTKDWSTYKLSKTSAKAKCIVKIINSAEGRACQDQLIDEQMEKYLAEAKSLGVTEIKAMMMCANLRHLGGLGAVKRVLGKTKTPYTLDNIYAALQTDTGNQVGAFRSRNKKVYNWLIQYIG
jgi:hypothetical protein